MPAAKGKGFASQLLKSLQIRPFCDHVPGDLSPEQQAALHAFLHEVLASYFRMRMVVPENTALTILDQRFADAFADPGRPPKG